MRYRYTIGGEVREVALERQGERYMAMIDGTPFEVQVLNQQPGELSLLVDGRPLRLYWAAAGDSRWVSLDGCTYQLEKPLGRSRRRGERSAEEAVRAPMPAQVRAVQVGEGETVEKGQSLMILEAMKMEIRIAAPQAGKVSRIHVQEGETVARDQILVELA